jgi:hypothetical protein
MCVSAFPDIDPWQVRQACVDSPQTSGESPCSDECMEDLYYSYLSHLLNPLDGHEGARHDAELVKEYCEWSVGIKPRLSKNPKRLDNFYNVASRSQIQHRRYRRDLLMLLELSMIVNKDDLSLDIGKRTAIERFHCVVILLLL